jgi:hypothetical protein
MPEGAVNCTRPGRYGNRFRAEEYGLGLAIRNFRRWAEGVVRIGSRLFESLRGKDLVCWCHLCDKHKDGKPLGVECVDCAPCHADVLLEIANAPEASK